MLKTWNATLFKPSEKTFVAERDRPTATLSTAITWILLAATISFFLGILDLWLERLWYYPPEFSGEVARPDFMLRIDDFALSVRYHSLRFNFWITDLYAEFWSFSNLTYDFGFLIFAPLHKFLGSTESEIVNHATIHLLDPAFALIRLFLYHFLARLVGGRGQLGRYAYLLAAFSAPMILLDDFIDLLPLLTSRMIDSLPEVRHLVVQDWYHTTKFVVHFTTFVVFVGYWFVPAFFATKVEHKLSWWRVIIALILAWVLGYAVSTFMPHVFFGFLRAITYLRY